MTDISYNVKAFAFNFFSGKKNVSKFCDLIDNNYTIINTLHIIFDENLPLTYKRVPGKKGYSDRYRHPISYINLIQAFQCCKVRCFVAKQPTKEWK